MKTFLCTGRPVLSVLSRLTCQADLFNPTCLCLCPSCPVLDILFRCAAPAVLPNLSCKGCPATVVLTRLFCSGCPGPAVLFQLFCPGCPVPVALPSNHVKRSPDAAILAFMSCLGQTLRLSSSPITADLPGRSVQLTCAGCPVPVVLS